MRVLLAVDSAALGGASRPGRERFRLSRRSRRSGWRAAATRPTADQGTKKARRRA
jgi:hypothetical protein